MEGRKAVEREGKREKKGVKGRRKEGEREGGRRKEREQNRMVWVRDDALPPLLPPF